MSESEPRVRIRTLLADREVRGILLAQITSEVGDHFARVGVASLVLVRSESVFLAALTFAVSYLPPVFGGILLSPFADRLSRKQVMLLCDAARAGLIALLAGAVVVEVPIAVLFALLIATEMFSVPFRAAREAMMPDILPEPRAYLAYSGLAQTLNQANQVMGLAFGGLMVKLTSSAVALLVDAGTFALSWVLLAMLVVGREAPISGRSGWRGLLFDVREGARLAFTHRVRRVLVLTAWASTLLLVAPEAVALAYAKAHGGDETAGGVLLASVPFGAMIGALLVTRRPPTSAVGMIRPAVLASAIPLLATGFDPPIQVAGVLWTVAGFAQGLFMPVVLMTVNLATPPEFRGRVNGLGGAGFSVATAVSFASAGALADVISAAGAVTVAGVLGLLLVSALAVRWPTTALTAVVASPPATR